MDYAEYAELEAVADTLMSSDLRDTVIEIFNSTVSTGVDRNELDGCYAALIRKESEGRLGHVLKSGYIFDTAEEALEVVVEMKAAQLKKVMAMVDFRRDRARQMARLR